jgi:hypothetical protein
LRRIHDQKVCASSVSAPGVRHGASTSTLRASRSSFFWAWATSARTAALMRGIVPL